MAIVKPVISGSLTTRFTTVSTIQLMPIATNAEKHVCLIYGIFRHMLKLKTMVSFPNRSNRSCNRATAAALTKKARPHVARIAIQSCLPSRQPPISKLTLPARRVVGDGNERGLIFTAL